MGNIFSEIIADVRGVGFVCGFDKGFCNARIEHIDRRVPSRPRRGIGRAGHDKQLGIAVR